MTRRGHGDGSVYHRSDGRWAASISLEDGKRKTIYGKSKKEVQECVRKAHFASLLRELRVERTRMVTWFTGDGNVTKEHSIPGKHQVWKSAYR